ncbi:MAG: ChbG/HpnK family deacetylase [Planctomycetes bacterium]|nr:ChbG/HpnK family deacetylase [Planctomycetota bacterium]
MDLPRNRGIAEAAARGLVTSVTVLSEGPAAADAFARLGELSGLGVGLHLNCTLGPPWVDKHRTWAALRAGALDLARVEEAFLRQTERFVEALGRAPTHLDGHNHVHVYPGLPELTCRVAARFGVRAVRVPEEPPGPARWDELRPLARAARQVFAAAGLASTDHFRGAALVGSLDEARLRALLSDLPQGSTELMVHPGYPDPGGLPFSSDARARELSALTSAAVRADLEAAGIRLVHFGTLGPCASSS